MLSSTARCRDASRPASLMQGRKRQSTLEFRGTMFVKVCSRRRIGRTFRQEISVARAGSAGRRQLRLDPVAQPASPRWARLTTFSRRRRSRSGARWRRRPIGSCGGKPAPPWTGFARPGETVGSISANSTATSGKRPVEHSRHARRLGTRHGRRIDRRESARGSRIARVGRRLPALSDPGLYRPRPRPIVEQFTGYPHQTVGELGSFAVQLATDPCSGRPSWRAPSEPPGSAKRSRPRCRRRR